MRRKIIIVCFVMIVKSSLLIAEDRGCTHKELYPEGLTCVGHATTFILQETSDIETPAMHRDSTWVQIDSLKLSHYVEAGQGYNIYYDDDTESLKQYPLYAEYPLTAESEQAIARAPKWLRNDLRTVLSHVSELHQPEWASAINNADDPYIDEIAFSIAHLSPQYLSANVAGDLYGSAQLLQENAELIYLNDQYLDYVEVIDYGSSTTDENYYSTTRYRKVDTRGDTLEVEVPKEIYYWYIVNPKITDEIPAYIDPNIIEDNITHNNNIVDPPEGVLWRDYLFNQADAGYPVLKDTLAGCTIIWDGTQNVNGSMTHATALITRWIHATMSFTSNYERPHQPVRIYKKHIGRCGEYADLTAAAARAALIPCTSILAISGDHTWNEFWDEGWIHWEPVNNSLNNPLVYENGWGKVFGSVFEIRSDGWLSSVTDRYSEGAATITIFALDSQGNPIDGAEVLLGVGSGTSILVDNYGLTDNEGKYTFVVGEGKHFYARVDTDIGSNPTDPGSTISLIDNTIDGEDYYFNFEISGTMPSLNYVASDVPEDLNEDYRLDVSFTVPSQIITGFSLLDDLDNVELYKQEDTGNIDHVMIAGYDLIWYLLNEPFIGFNIYSNATQGDIAFDIPVGSDWYSCLSNMSHLNNYQYVDGMARLFHYNVSVDEPSISGSTDPILINNPNPFTQSTTISLSSNVNHHDMSVITIFNIKGQKIRCLEPIHADDRYSVIWDGTDQNNQKVQPGVYFYMSVIDGETYVNKMILMY